MIIIFQKYIAAVQIGIKYSTKIKTMLRMLNMKAK